MQRAPRSASWHTPENRHPDVRLHSVGCYYGVGAFSLTARAHHCRLSATSFRSSSLRYSPAAMATFCTLRTVSEYRGVRWITSSTLTPAAAALSAVSATVSESAPAVARSSQLNRAGASCWRLPWLSTRDAWATSKRHNLASTVLYSWIRCAYRQCRGLNQCTRRRQKQATSLG